MDNGVIILCLPPNTSHALQPLDVGVFAPLKKIWKDVLKTWYRESRQQKVTKASFPFLLNKLFNFLKPINAAKGFEGSGLYPVNIEKVKPKILLTEKKFPCNKLQIGSISLEQIGASTSQAQVNQSVVPCPQNQDEPAILQNSIHSTTTNQNLEHDQSNENSLQHGSSIDKFSSLVNSPFKDLKVAILTTLSPEPSTNTKHALKNSNKIRKKVQCKTGEILTEETVAQRLLVEEQERQAKKRKMSQKSTRNVPARNEVDEKKLNPPAPQVDAKNVKPGTWVTVEYEGKKSKLRFNGQITNKVNNMYEVKFLSKRGQKYIFPEIDDIDVIAFDSIVEILQKPTLDNRGHYSFV